MGQQLCCVSQNESYSGSKQQQKSNKSNQSRKNKNKNFKGLDDGSIVRLPEIIDSSSDAAGKDTSESNAQREQDRCEEISVKQNQTNEIADEPEINLPRQRVREGYSRTFEQFDSSNNIDLSRSMPKDARSQENINLNYRLTLTGNNNTNNNQTPPSFSNSTLLNIPASSKLIYQKQEQIEKKKRSENSQLMEKYLLMSCQNRFAGHYYAKKVEKKQNKPSQSNQNQDQRSSAKNPLEIIIENELKALLNSKLIPWLDDEDTPSVFVFYDADNLQLIKLIFVGARNSSFAFGIFCFDMLIPSDYPQCPPRVHLDSQMSQAFLKVAPYVQSDGRVCLDILGTQVGRESENNQRKWQPGISNFQSVIESIQQLILSEDALLNARLEQGDINQDELNMRNNYKNISSSSISDISVGDRDQLYESGYNNAVKYVTLSNSMEFIMNLVVNEQIDDLQMAQMIGDHFMCNEENIKDMSQDWIKQEESRSERPLYAGIVEQHYPEISQLLRQKGFARLVRDKMKNMEIMTRRIKEKRHQDKQQ